MIFPGKISATCALGLALLPLASAPALAADPLAWPPLTAQTRPWAWWWWHGSAVDETNLNRELQRFHAAGLGGVQITSIYGIQGAEAREIPYLSPRWLATLGHTVDAARQLGLGVDMSLGSGWCFGGPTVSDHDANASVVVKTISVPPGGKLEGKFPPASTQALIAFAPDGESLTLTGKIAATGAVDWTAPASATHGWTVYAISQKPSGQKVKRPALGGEGWMLNPAYPQAMQDWLKWFDGAFTNYTGSKPEAVFQDSYEYRTDWAPDFLAQFARRRGYPLQAELPALFAGDAAASQVGTRLADPDHVARVKFDYRRTLSEIMAGESEPAWIDWAHRHGFAAIYQAHGTPGNWLDLYGDADLPETEMFHNDRSILISKFASSAAHTQGHPLTGAETGTWLREHFTETLADLKHLADDMLLSGVNHIYYHGACYSPDDAPWPGWLFYASTEMNPRNPIWHDVGTLNEYIARCQSVLQSGQPDNDVLLYWPVADFWTDPAGRVLPMSVSKTEWFEGQPIGKTAHALWNQGQAFDYVSDAQLQQASIVGGKIQMPGGQYQLIVVPECRYIPLATFQQLLTLARAGATVVFEKQLPADVAGAGNLEKQRAEFKSLTAKCRFQTRGTREILPGKSDVATLGKGRLLCTDLTAFALENAAPETMSESGLAFIRRSFDGGWNYFIANPAATNFDGWIQLARPAKTAALLDPMTGQTGIAAQDAQGRIHLQLAPGGSIILRALASQQASGPAWTYWQPLIPAQPQPLTGNWKIHFLTGGPVLPADSQTPHLASWTTLPDPNAQAFAGTAQYALTFALPGVPAATCALDLGDVRQSARVRLNGKDYGTLITPPYRVLVDNLKPADNLLEVEVTSVAANRIRDLDRRGVNWKYFKDINLVDVNYHPFDAASWPLTDCGLLGPVTLAAQASRP